MCENVDCFVVPICEAENAAKDVHGGSVVGVNIFIKSVKMFNNQFTINLRDSGYSMKRGGGF